MNKNTGIMSNQEVEKLLSHNPVTISYRIHSFLIFLSPNRTPCCDRYKLRQYTSKS